MTLIDFTLLDVHPHELWVFANGTDYEVRDSANHEVTMIRAPDLYRAVRFMRVFCERNPGASWDQGSMRVAAGHSVRVPPLRLVPMSEAADG